MPISGAGAWLSDRRVAQCVQHLGIRPHHCNKGERGGDGRRRRRKEDKERENCFMCFAASICPLTSHDGGSHPREDVCGVKDIPSSHPLRVLTLALEKVPLLILCSRKALGMGGYRVSQEAPPWLPCQAVGTSSWLLCIRGYFNC